MEMSGIVIALSCILLVSILINIKMYLKESIKGDKTEVDFDLISNMSHDLRTPLNAICGYSELIKLCAGEDFRISEYVSVIDESSKMLMELIGDILDHSKIKTGKMQICKREVSLQDYIDNIESIHKIGAESKGIEFNMSFTNNTTNKIVYIDPLRVKRIFNNLISNAIKFTSEGGVYVDVTLSENELFFVIKDTGVGIESSKQKLIFKKFIQESSKTPINFGGSGLGLNITRNLVKLMHGKILLNSQKGIGTTFKVTLPLKESDKVEMHKTRGISKKR